MNLLNKKCDMWKFLYGCLLAGMALNANAEEVKWNTPGAGNPFIPGYFADPTVKKFGDTYYVYATTDGSGAGFGPSQVWCSKDFENWTIMPMNWPDSHWIWAPDVMQHTDGTYRMFYCQPCNIYEGVAETPRGPWKNVLGESEAVLVPDRFVKNAITLDGQTFVDDDGSVYLYWGTWGIYKGFGCGAGKMTPDMKGFTETRLIPNTEVKDFFEAPFVMKKDGVYFFMYSSESCHDSTYHVQYATSTEGPLGPYTYKGTILKTSKDGTVHGPGHHSILKEGNDYYIVYHRHDNPHSNRGFHRQLCIDKLEFNSDGTITPIEGSHSGVKAFAPSVLKSENLAYRKPVKVSSYYDDNFLPEYAVDDNNGTLWRPRTMGQEWIEIDLEKIQNIRTVWTQFEYGTSYYQYVIETSADGKNWEVFADKRNNYLAGSPMVDFGDVKARYVRLTTTGTQKNGFAGALWNIKVFGEYETASPQLWVGLSGADWNGTEWANNGGMLGGSFKIKSGRVSCRRIDGQDALVLAPGTELELVSPVVNPDTEHTASVWTYVNGEWKSVNADKFVGKGKISVKSGTEEMVITNFRYYNWKLEDVEKEYDSKVGLTRINASDRIKKGLLVSVDANDFAAGDTVAYIPNRGIVEGYFETQNEPVIVENIQGKMALRFDSCQYFRSSFTLPATLRDNAPYTLEAWVLNPEMSVNECVADFTSSHDEMEKIMLVNGTEPRCGIINHYGWYEDAGYKDAKTLENKWQHIYIVFDGRIENVYINGQLISSKDIQLLIKPVQYVTLGRNAENEWPFSGYIHSLKIWDEAIPFKNEQSNNN